VVDNVLAFQAMFNNLLDLYEDIRDTDEDFLGTETPLELAEWSRRVPSKIITPFQEEMFLEKFHVGTTWEDVYKMQSEMDKLVQEDYDKGRITEGWNAQKVKKMDLDDKERGR